MSSQVPPPEDDPALGFAGTTTLTGSENSAEAEDFVSGEEQLAGLLGALARAPEAPRGQEDALRLRAGQLVGGKFRLQRQIGRGGMGSVWRAEHESLKTPVAIKFLLSRFEDDDTWRGRFEREARAAASLRCSNVVQVFDHGVSEGLPYIAMEFLEGESLRARLEREGKLSNEGLLWVISGSGRAIAQAHRAGIVHRDLKPDNLFIVREADGHELLKVLDFGIAKILVSEDSAGASTGTGVILGTPRYMSPEQLRNSKHIDARADLWALGVIAFECLVGRRPFLGDNVGELILQICSMPAPVPSSVGPVPEKFDAWFERAVHQDIDRRFQSVEELFTALVEALAPGQRISLHMSDARPLRGSPVAAPSATPRASRGRSVALAAVGSVLLGAALLAAVMKRPSAQGLPSALSASALVLASSRAEDPASASLRAELAQQGWLMSGEGRDFYELRLDPEQLRNGRPTLGLFPRGDPGGRYGIWMRLVDAKPYKGKRVQATLFIRTEGATQRADFGARIQALDSPPDGNGLGGYWHKLPATSGWERRSVVLDIPEAARQIQLGVGIAGPGRIWLDAPTLEVVDDEVPLSGHEHDQKMAGWELSGPGAEHSMLVQEGDAIHLTSRERGRVVIERTAPAKPWAGRKVSASLEFKTRGLSSGATCFLSTQRSRHEHVPLSLAQKALPHTSEGFARCDLSLSVEADARWVVFGINHGSQGELWLKHARIDAR